jgi:DNA-binding winged helix-turn-helix (wHTH) protein
VANQVRFGPFRFYFHLSSGELFRATARVPIQRQPAEILALLLERPGQVVTREELRNHLWPDGTFVDFEHSVNTAIKKLRRALGDSSARPRYVETLPRRGYRLVVPVDLPSDEAPPAGGVGGKPTAVLAADAPSPRGGAGLDLRRGRAAARRWPNTSRCSSSSMSCSGPTAPGLVETILRLPRPDVNFRFTGAFGSSPPAG